jgi:hypothetical protein
MQATASNHTTQGERQKKKVKEGNFRGYSILTIYEDLILMLAYLLFKIYTKI